MNPEPNELAVIIVHINIDRDKVDRAVELFDKGTDVPYSLILIDGVDVPDLSKCLNQGIQTAISLGCKYFTFAHTDMDWTVDTQWYQTLRKILEDYPAIMKICASNSRDPIGDFRIGQEQAYLMRVQDFVDHPWIFFREEFIRCGGREDHFQHIQIFQHGYFVAITPTAIVYHEGMGTRGKYDTTTEQIHNATILHQLLNGEPEDINTRQNFGRLLSREDRDAKLVALPPELAAMLE